MTPRELAGAINRASVVLAFVEWNAEGGGGWVTLAKTAAKAIVAEAKKNDVTDIFAETDGDELLIGGPYTDDGETEVEPDEDSDEDE